MKTEFWENATPEQLNFWNICRIKIGFNTITPLYFCGPIAASEFLVYNAAKLYIAFELGFSGAVLSATNAFGQLYDEANVAVYQIKGSYIAWDVTASALKYAAPTMEVKNAYFSRITYADFVYMKFNGYRLDML